MGQENVSQKTKRTLSKAVEIMTNPFGFGFPFFLSLCLLVASADLIFWAKGGNLLFGGYMAIHGIIMCYIVSVIVYLFTGIVRKILEIFFLILGFINLILDASVHSICGFGFTEDMIALIMGTNAQESAEFVMSYVNIHMILCIVGVSLLVGLVHIFKDKLALLLPLFFRFLCVIGVFLSMGYVGARHSQNWSCVFLNKIRAFANYEQAESLLDHRREFDLIEQGEKPDNIVLIIGESLSKTHMSAYGYDKKTTPYLEKNDLTVLFNNVTSGWTSTIESFIKFMTLHQSTNEKRSFLAPNIMDLMKSAGYHSTWISNQSSSGAHDNYVARFAELADTIIWCGQQNVGLGKKDFDEIVIPETTVCFNGHPHNNFIIIHLMGSHPEFNLRYPEYAHVFKESDYSNFPKNQRKPLSEYDNSVLYNDMVTDKLFQIFHDSETIAIYFSDHGLDIFDSAEDYVGHARLGTPISVEAGRRIPFIMYMTPEFRQKFDDFSTTIISSSDKEFCTENFANTLLDIAHVRLSEQVEPSDSLSLLF